MLNVLHIIYLYQRIKSDNTFRPIPRTFIFGAKAAPSYYFAKKVIELICSLEKTINNDPVASKYIKVVFIENYEGGSSKLEQCMELIKSGVEFAPRTPLIPGVTDTVQNLTAIAKLLQSYGLNYMELLPYNPMAGSKYALAGKNFQPTYDPSQTPQTHEEVFDAYGIKVKVY